MYIEEMWEDYKADLTAESYKPYELFIQDFLEAEDITEDEFETSALSYLLSDLHYREVPIRYTHDPHGAYSEQHKFELSDRYGSFSVSHHILLAALIQVMILEQKRYAENPL